MQGKKLVTGEKMTLCKKFNFCFPKGNSHFINPEIIKLKNLNLYCKNVEKKTLKIGFAQNLGKKIGCQFWGRGGYLVAKRVFQNLFFLA